MKRKKFKDIKTKEDRQELLQYLLNKEIDKLRLKIYKYQRRDVFNYPVTIEETDFDKLSTAGQYNWDKENKTHKIYITTRYVDGFIRQDYDPDSAKIFDKIRVHNTILHELVHALVREKFEMIYSKIKGKNFDGSPIFLATLQFLDGESSHDCAINYFLTKTWREVQDLKTSGATWNDFTDYIFLYLQSIYKLQEDFNKENMINGKQISFSFGCYESGLNKESESISHVNAYVRDRKEFKNITIESVTFEIGSMMYPDKIKELLPKKLNNDVRADISYISYGKLLCEESTQYTNWVYKKDYKYNKYDKEKKVADLKK